jgi:hypothetical protein
MYMIALHTLGSITVDSCSTSNTLPSQKTQDNGAVCKHRQRSDEREDSKQKQDIATVNRVIM